MLPAVNALRKNFPDSEITLLADEWISPLKSHFTDIDNVLILKNTFSNNLFKKISSALWLIQKLNKMKFDLTLIGHRNNTFGWITYLSGIRYRLGFTGTTHINVPTEFKQNLNESRRYLEVVANAGIDISESTYGFKSSDSSESIKNKLAIPPDKKVMGIFPFGGINPGMDMKVKRWELLKFLEIGKLISENYSDVEVIFFEGTGADEKIENNSIRKIPIGINEISVCDFFIGNDTGSLHIANALEIKALGIFGPTDPNIFGPFNINDNFSFVRHQIHCSPCFNTEIALVKGNRVYWDGNKFLCHENNHACMKELSVEKVFNEIKKLL